MAWKFDFKGHLIPDSGLEGTHEVFQRIFVDPQIPGYDNRLKLWNMFEEWLGFYRKYYHPTPEIWVDGSFVNRRKTPRDLDLVVRVPLTIYESKNMEPYFQSLMKNRENRGGFYLDIYPLVDVPEDHHAYTNFRWNYAYWQHYFARTRPNTRTGKSDRKGFIILRYG